MSIVGNILLILALLAALYGGVTFILGARQKNNRLVKRARQVSMGVFWLITLTIGILLIAFLSHDFGLQYVYENSSLNTPVVYLLSAVWRGNGGALLFWGWIIALAGTMLLRQAKKINDELLPYTMATLLFTNAVFLALIFVDNPFKRTAEIASDGIGLNPLLQNAGMLFHPPTLIAGWALMVVPFALALAALITRRLGNDWLIPARRWALAAWIALGLGNLLGAWWAYRILDWGGYWAWDPVENAGLLPWLAVTAFLHATMMQQRRGLFKTWSLLLIIFAFGLTIFGAMVTRTNLSALHGFGQSAMGPVLLIFLLLSLTVSVGLLFSRRHELKEEPGDAAIVSGETTFLLNNLLFTAAALGIFVGTIFPFLTKLFGGSSVGMQPSFFNTIGVPLFLAIILLSGVCILVGWHVPEGGRLRKPLLWALVLAFATVIVLLILGRNEWYALVGVFILTFMLAATFVKWWQDVVVRHVITKESYYRAGLVLWQHNRSRYGGYIVHLGIALIALGVLGSSVYKFETEATPLNPGESMIVEGYTVTLADVTQTSGADRMIFPATVIISRGGRQIATLHPRDIYYSNYGWAPDTAIHSTLGEDVWISVKVHDDMGQPLDTPLVTVLISPLVSWIWLGGLVLLLGGLRAYGGPQRKETAE